MKAFQVLSASSANEEFADYNPTCLFEGNEKEAREFFDNHCSSNCSPASPGETTRVTLVALEEDEDGDVELEELEEAGLPSPALGEQAVVVIFGWHRHVGYSRDIKEVRWAMAGETWAALPYNDHIFRPNAVVYESPADLQRAYERGDLKIHSGADLVRDFLEAAQ